MTTGPASGTLEEPQVRAMFDRIAGVYDLMNSVMTAGMHHRWRSRAVDLARVGQTMVVVTHDHAFAKRAATWVVELAAGRVARQGSAAELL